MSRRRVDQLCVALGALWILDGLLQLQPYMLGPRFFPDVLGMAEMGLPGPLRAAEWHIAQVASAHTVLCDVLLASTQLALGAAIVAARTRRPALMASIPWALFVWVVGEGVGGLFMPGASMLTGAPGPALLYAVVAAVLLRAGSGTTCWSRPPGRKESTAGVPGGPWTWVALWIGDALLELAPANHAAGVPAAQIGDGASGLPGPFAAFDRVLASGLGHAGAAFAVTAALVQAGLGLLALSDTGRRPALWAAGCLSVVYWLVGQHMGDVLSGQATDVSAGPLWVLLALTVWRTSVPQAPPAADEWRPATPGNAVLAP